MKKTYWWRACLILLALAVLTILFAGPCNQKLSRCLGGDSIATSRTLFHIFSSILIISSFLFFVSDIVFRKWLRFAIIWILLTIIFVILAPVSTGGFIDFGPTKELVSIWMGVLFVIISLVLIVWQSIKERKNGD